MIHDLDFDIQEPEIVYLYEYKNGKKIKHEIDISFIPSGISIPLLRKYDEWLKASNKFIKYLNDDLKPDPEKIKKMTDKEKDESERVNNMQLEIIAILTSYLKPELTIEWLKHTQPLEQIEKFISIVINSITRYVNNRNKASKKKLNGKELSENSA